MLNHGWVPQSLPAKLITVNGFVKGLAGVKLRDVEELQLQYPIRAAIFHSHLHGCIQNGAIINQHKST